MRNIYLFILLSMVMPPAWAEGYSVSLNAGSAGLGLEFATGVTEQINARLGFNTSRSKDFTLVNPSRFNAISHLRKDLELLADWHPFDNGFRTSFGLVYYHANHKLTKSSSIARVVTTTVRDGNIFSCLFTFWSSCDDIISQSAITYPWADFGTHSYDVRYRSYGPYLGVGYDTAASATGWGIVADVGAFYRGSPTVTTSFTCGTSNPIGTPTCDAYQNALSAESDAMKANYPKWMPKFSVGVKYGF